MKKNTEKAERESKRVLYIDIQYSKKSCSTGIIKYFNKWKTRKGF